MSNCCIGTLKCVAKNKETLDRILKILKYEDSEYALSRCKDADSCGEAFKDGDYWVQDFYVDGAWNCCQFFEQDDCINKKIVVDYENDENGKIDYMKPIYGTAHITGLPYLCEKLDFGCELFSTEPGCCFEEYCWADKNGYSNCESDTYNLKYPLDENGEENYDAEPEEIHGMDCFMEFSFPSEIYDRS